MATHQRILYWFRNDLRLHDNEGFANACTDAQEVLPVFIIDPRLFRTLPTLGIAKTGLWRTRFLLESLADLRASLQARGGDLLIRVGEPARLLAELAQEMGAGAIYASKEVTDEETEVESALSKRLKPLNIDIDFFWTSTLIHPRDLPFSVVNMPDIFTQFRQKVERYTAVRPTIPAPAQVRLPSGFAGGEMPTLASLGFTSSPVADERAAMVFQGGESAGLARLNSYLWERDLLKTYKETRNGLLGDAYSSKLSAWLANGCVSPRQIFEEVKRYEQERIANESTYWLIFELYWRDFFRFVALKYGSRIFRISGIRYDMQKTWREDPVLFGKWANGETGFPFVDANMRELLQTGFMSNRGRQNVASFLVNDLGINWTWGARWFESLLVDYDPCSNWGNWNYVAGVGNDPREGRYFNILSQATRYDADGAYVKHWLPELASLPAEAVHRVPQLSAKELRGYGVLRADTYPAPIVTPNHR